MILSENSDKTVCKQYSTSNAKASEGYEALNNGSLKQRMIVDYIRVFQ